MAEFRIRTVAPVKGQWRTVEGETWADAVQDAHLAERLIDSRIRIDGEILRVCRVEVEGHGLTWSRIFQTGIYRAGGVKPLSAPRTLADVAQAVEWDRPPEALLDPAEWEGEEEYGRG